jgi:hypothetical protein
MSKCLFTFLSSVLAMWFLGASCQCDFKNNLWLCSSRTWFFSLPDPVAGSHQDLSATYHGGRTGLQITFELVEECNYFEGGCLLSKSPGTFTKSVQTVLPVLLEWFPSVWAFAWNFYNLEDSGTWLKKLFQFYILTSEITFGKTVKYSIMSSFKYLRQFLVTFCQLTFVYLWLFINVYLKFLQDG